MDKFVIIVFILGLNTAYWFDFLRTFEQTSGDGTFGKATIGLVLLAVSLILIFSLNRIL